MNRLARAVYHRLPGSIQDLAVSAVGAVVSHRRYGGDYQEIENQVRLRGNWSAAEIEAFRDHRLRVFASKCRAEIPFYSGSDYAGLDEIESLHDLSHFPIIDKQTVRRERDHLVPRDLGGLSWMHTSGTTGAGLRFPATSSAMREQWAIWWRYRYLHGITPGTWCAHFGGRDVATSDRVWRIDHSQRRLVFSAYHTNPSHLDQMISVLNRRRPLWMHGYPSLLALVAHRLLETTGELDYRMGWVTIGAENLDARQEQLISAAFGTRVVQHYGLAEMAANASECREGSLHIDEDFAAVEVCEGEIVGTSLSNWAFPLVRYRTGDLASVANSTCGCGRHGRVLEQIDGRSEDYLILSDGSSLGRLDHVLKDATAVRCAQFIQSEPGRALLLIEAGEGFDGADLVDVSKHLSTLTGERLTLTSRVVERIPKSPSGKHRLVVRSTSANSHSP